MTGVRKRPVHPVVQRCLDSARAIHVSDTAKRAGESPEYLYKIADPKTMEGFIGRMERWAAAMGVSPHDFLKEVSLYIEQKSAKTDA